MYRIVLATVNEKLTGLQIRLLNDITGDIQVVFLPREQCGKIPKNKDVKKELQLFADILIGKQINFIKE